MIQSQVYQLCATFCEKVDFGCSWWSTARDWSNSTKGSRILAAQWLHGTVFFFCMFTVDGVNRKFVLHKHCTKKKTGLSSGWVKSWMHTNKNLAFGEETRFRGEQLPSVRQQCLVTSLLLLPGRRTCPHNLKYKSLSLMIADPPGLGLGTFPKPHGWLILSC